MGIPTQRAFDALANAELIADIVIACKLDRSASPGPDILRSMQRRAGAGYDD